MELFCGLGVRGPVNFYTARNEPVQRDPHVQRDARPGPARNQLMSPRVTRWIKAQFIRAHTWRDVLKAVLTTDQKKKLDDILTGKDK